jgi:uncharacterized LabA/DUF88 family protein
MTMPKNEATQSRTVALYWDFENIHAGLCDDKEPGSYARPDSRFKPQEPLVNVQAIVDFAASFGPIAINRAYCNWQFFGRYRDALLQNAVELVQLFPPGGAAKNGADIKLCLDATEDVGRFPHIGTVIIVGGDSDFMPVSQKIKAAGRTLVGVGLRKATNRHWAKSCHDFRYYETLLADAAPAPVPAAAPNAEPNDPLAPAFDASADLIRKALRLLAEKRDDGWVDEGEILPMVKRLDPTFQVTEHGFTTFAAMLQSLEDIEVRKGEHDHQVRLR